MERHLEVHIGSADVYLSLAGGLDVRERGTDLAVVAAVLSSLRSRPLSGEMAVVGEVGLTGEIRPVRRLSERVAEAAKLGVRRVLVPAGTRIAAQDEVELVPVERVGDAVEQLAFL